MKQVNIGQWWGMFKLLYQQVTVYVSAISYAMTATTLYLVATRSIIPMPYWVFVIILIAIVLLLMLLEFLLSLASVYSVQNKQAWIHDNPMREYLERRDRIYTNKLNQILKRLPKGKS
ncbi:MAG: hypothetical protein PHQ22_10875 [Sulfuricurvum sp.]|nr:hypothetical protein [Sulfuricurvum sp.]